MFKYWTCFSLKTTWRCAGSMLRYLLFFLPVRRRQRGVLVRFSDDGPVLHVHLGPLSDLQVGPVWTSNWCRKVVSADRHDLNVSRTLHVCWDERVLCVLFLMTKSINAVKYKCMSKLFFFTLASQQVLGDFKVLVLTFKARHSRACVHILTCLLVISRNSTKNTRGDRAF